MLTEEQRDLKGLILRLRLASESLTREDFCAAVARALVVLDIGYEEAARIFGIARPTAARWARGEAAPAKQVRTRCLTVLISLAVARLQASEDMAQRVCRRLLNDTGEKASKRERAVIEAICALVEPELRRANDPRNHGWDDPHSR